MYYNFMSFNFFKKKVKNIESLEQAKLLGLITEEEMLQLKLERIKQKLKNLSKEKKIK